LIATLESVSAAQIAVGAATTPMTSVTMIVVS